MGLNWAEHTIEIDAPIETCYAAIIDYETFPSWQGAVVDTEVLDWDEAGRGKRVRLFIDAKIRKVDYTLDYRYDQPTRIEWDFVEGNGISDADGHYLFEDLGADRTRATYKLGLEVGIPLPGPVARRAHKSTLKASVEDLKKEAERRAAAVSEGGERRSLRRWTSVKRSSPRRPGSRSNRRLPRRRPQARPHSTDGGSDSTDGAAGQGRRAGGGPGHRSGAPRGRCRPRGGRRCHESCGESARPRIRLERPLPALARTRKSRQFGPASPRPLTRPRRSPRSSARSRRARG